MEGRDSMSKKDNRKKIMKSVEKGCETSFFTLAGFFIWLTNNSLLFGIIGIACMFIGVMLNIYYLYSKEKQANNTRLLLEEPVSSYVVMDIKAINNLLSERGYDITMSIGQDLITMQKHIRLTGKHDGCSHSETLEKILCVKNLIPLYIGNDELVGLIFD